MKKVVECKTNCFGGNIFNLKVGKHYLAIEQDDCYILENEGGAIVPYHKSMFEEVNSKNRLEEIQMLVEVQNNLSDEETIKSMMLLSAESLGLDSSITVAYSNLYHKLFLNIKQKEKAIKSKYGNTLKKMVCEGR